jgi:hypothetical protein
LLSILSYNRPIVIQATLNIDISLFHEQKELNSNNYYYIGINNNECTGEEWTGELPEFNTQQSVNLVTECFNKGDGCDSSRWQSFLDVLDRYRSQKDINVIYSFGSFGTMDFTVQANKERFLRLTDQWDVEILMNYRHYHDWVLSLYREMYRQRILMHASGELWPEEGGANMTSFPDSFDDRFTKPLSDVMEQLYSTNSLTVYRTFLQMFDNVRVLDIHEDRTFENLICSFPGADTACAKVSLMNVETRSAGSEYTELIMFDLIALAARTAGLIDPKLTRAFVRDEIQKHAKTLDPNYSFPLKCLSTVQERELYRLSAKLADVMPVKSLVDPHFSEVNQFCEPDTEKVLADKNWVDFFLSLTMGPTIDIGKGLVKIDDAAPPINGITLYESFSIESKIISTIRGITNETVDLKGTGEKKPKLYLHVGPPKHGTTSFQCALAKIQVSCYLSFHITGQ